MWYVLTMSFLFAPASSATGPHVWRWWKMMEAHVELHTKMCLLRLVFVPYGCSCYLVALQFKGMFTSINTCGIQAGVQRHSCRWREHTLKFCFSSLGFTGEKMLWNKRMITELYIHRIMWKCVLNKLSAFYETQVLKFNWKYRFWTRQTTVQVFEDLALAKCSYMKSYYYCKPASCTISLIINTTSTFW